MRDGNPSRVDTDCRRDSVTVIEYVKQEDKITLAVNVGGLKMKNPVIAASGTFGYGREYSRFYDLSLLGGISVKGVTLKPRPGNPPPRIYETAAGMLNSIGLQNPGVDSFVQDELPFLAKYDTAVIVNISGSTIEEYAKLAEILDAVRGISGIEVNVSCPNIKDGGITFGTDPDMVRRVTEAVKNKTSLPVIVKLSPNVGDIGKIARAAESGGADSISLINTLLGMAIDVKSRRPVLANIRGGLSGPAVKPVAVRMVWDVFDAVSIPIIGMGGIMTAFDAVEFMLAGANAVSIGTANFTNPFVCPQVVDGIREYLEKEGFRRVQDIVGIAH